MRFSLKLLLVAATLVAVVLGFWSADTRRQAFAVARLKGLGFTVSYQPNAWLPDRFEKFLCRMLGKDYIRQVGLVVAGRRFDDYSGARLYLKQLQGLQKVWFYKLPAGLTVDEVETDFPGVDVVFTPIFQRRKSLVLTPDLVL